MNMSTIRKTIICIAAAAAALVAVSCQKDDTLAYNNMTMGNVVNGKFVSDQGNTFNIVEQICGGKLENEKRAMVLCDVLKKTAGADKEYDIRLTQFASVLVKDAVAIQNASEGDIAVQDPILIDQLWFSGGYINLLVKYYEKSGSDTKHFINLVYEKNPEGKYILNFRHNAYGEVITSENQSKMMLVGAYVSFPIKGVISESEANLTLKWKWYEEDNIVGGININKEKEFSHDLKYSKEGYEHTF